MNLETIFQKFMSPEVSNLISAENMINSPSDNSVEYEKDGHNLKVKVTDNCISMEYTYNSNKLKEEFKNYCNRLDDDIFIRACEDYTNNNSDYPLNKLDTNPDEKHVAEFKEYARQAIIAKINRLEKLKLL